MGSANAQQSLNKSPRFKTLHIAFNQGSNLKRLKVLNTVRTASRQMTLGTMAA
jgi:hypothetical protein